MKQGWEVVKLGEVLKLNLDSVDVNSMSDFPFAGVYSFGKGLFKRGNQSGSETSYKTFNRLHKNQIIVSKVKGWEGAIAKVEEDFEGLFLSPICPTFDLISEQKADIHFIDWFLKQEFVWQKLFADSKGIGARRNSISEKQFLNLEIPLPPLSEQQRIAGRLAALKGKIDAVRALRGEQVREVERVTQNFGEQFFEELGKEVPTKLFEEICDVVRGGSPRPAGDPTFYGDGYLPFLKIGDVTNDNEIYVQGYAETLTKAGLTKTRVVEPNTLLLTNSGATLGVPKITAFKTAFNDGIQAFINFKEDVNLEYLYFFLKSKTGHFRKILARGQGQPNLNTEMVKKTSIPLPSLSEQHRIVSEIKAFQTKTQALKAAQAGQLSALGGVFPGVLEQAFRGEW